MTFLPVLERELRVGARRPGTFWVRTASAASAYGILMWLWVSRAFSGGGFQDGSELFGSLSLLLLSYALLVGLGETVDSISEEKREGTLGLLFLTDLKGYDVVAGKLAATSLTSIYGLFATVPVLAIPLMLGGVTSGEFWRMVLLLVVTLVFSLSVSIFCSAVSRSEARARLAMAACLLLFELGIPALEYWFLPKPVLGMPAIFISPSSWMTFKIVPDLLYRSNANAFWGSLGLLHGISWVFLMAASLAIGRTWQQRPESAAALKRRQTATNWSSGESHERVVYRRSLLEKNPYYWRAGRARWVLGAVLGTLGVFGLFWFWLWMQDPSGMLERVTFVFTSTLLHFFLKIWWTAQAVRPMNKDLREGAFELLLSTPLTVHDFVRGVFLALRRNFGWAIIIVLGADSIMMLHATVVERGIGSETTWMLIWFSAIIAFVLDLFSLAWLGMWLGVKSKKSFRPFLGTILRILVLPWAVYLGMVTILGLFRAPFLPLNSPEMAVRFWLGIIVAIDLYYIWWSRKNLLQHFRSIASEQFDRGKIARAA